ncbi:alpha-crystallin B chain [Austrofundulus limnaeus]|uniref:Alpha-crystallin B chain n=1 Tax=Austrofundulus limnaeus TaxID=52670 RepID=A0A2I4ASZ3_AUSLI|nr:PREDICTED: alpha-crystallin B chain [Austrofundulus limnaeus]
MQSRRAEQHPPQPELPSRLQSSQLSKSLAMDISIQHPWYRRVFPNRLPDFYLAEQHADWPLTRPWPWNFFRMHPSFPHWPENGHTEMRMEKDRYVIYLDVKHFSPDELSVNVSDDFITVHAKHEERQDSDGFVSREFLRKYRLPSGVSTADVTSNLSPDGVLTITAPRSSPGQEHSVPITFDNGKQKHKNVE